MTNTALQSLQKEIETRMYPLWDIDTSIHVLQTGSYELLPKIIEYQLNDTISNNQPQQQLQSPQQQKEEEEEGRKRSNNE